MLPAIPVETPFQSLVVEQALAYAKDMEATANGAADGQVLDRCELLTLANGRDLLRSILTAAAQQQAATVEKKGPRLAPVRADTPAARKAARPEPS